MWVRAEGPTISIQGRLGATHLSGELALGKNGVFIDLGPSSPDASAIVKLSKPGWVDFGRGELKNEIPEARTYSAGSLVSPVPAADPAPAPTPWPPMADDDEALERWRFADLRQARGLSLVETADRLEAMTGVIVSKDTLRRYETGIGEPHNRFLSAALDHVLGADGHLSLLTIRRGQGDGAVRFPPIGGRRFGLNSVARPHNRCGSGSVIGPVTSMKLCLAYWCTIIAYRPHPCGLRLRHRCPGRSA